MTCDKTEADVQKLFVISVSPIIKLSNAPQQSFSPVEVGPRLPDPETGFVRSWMIRLIRSWPEVRFWEVNLP